MKLFTRMTILALAVVTGLFADVQFGGPGTIGSGAIQLNAAFNSASIDGAFVQRIAIRVVPGYCGKIYVSLGSAPDMTGYTNVIKVLYPNCGGGLSDEYVLEDRSGYDGIDSSKFYVNGGEPGDVFLFEFSQTGSQNTVHLAAVTYGALPAANWASNFNWVKIGSAANAAAAVAQFAIIPGQTGKFTVQSPKGAEKVLYPNNGAVTGNITDKWEIYGSPAGNGNTVLVTSGGFTVQRQVAGENILVAMWVYS